MGEIENEGFFFQLSVDRMLAREVTLVQNLNSKDLFFSYGAGG